MLIGIDVLHEEGVIYLGFELSIFGGSFGGALVQKQAVSELMKLGDVTEQYGLALTEQQAIALVETRSISLSATGRTEFGGGVIEKIIYEFCDSPYISMRNYESTLHELIEIFYYYKNDSLDLLSDDELIKYMKKSFDGVCQGSLELLFGRELDTLARDLRFGRKHLEDTPTPEEDQEDEDDEY